MMTAVPNHWLHVFQRPAQGSGFIKRYLAYNYQHTIVNQGWFDTASCDIGVHSESEGNNILLNYLGAFVQIYVDNPIVPVWEGLINRIIFNAGGASYTISLDDMANRVSVVYTGAANAGTEVAPTNYLGSQAIYGVKQDQVELGPDPSAGSQRTNLRDVILSQRAFPQTSWTQGQGEANTVHFELIGIFHTIEWEKLFSGLTAATTTFSARVTNAIAALANGATFFDNADTTHISTNTATLPQQQRAISVWENIMKIAEAGDGTNYWIAGVLPTDPNIKTRRFYYQIANFAVEYTARQADGLRTRNLYGKEIPPWLVVPDRSIRVIDTLVGFGSSVSTDPRLTYIQSVQYDANSQKAQFFGDDNTTARAAFQLNRRFKSLGKNMPNTAPLRVIVT